MDNNKNPPNNAGGKDEPGAPAECRRCVFVSACPDAYNMPGPCGAFVDEEDTW